jgi:hypothetical protein
LPNSCWPRFVLTLSADPPADEGAALLSCAEGAVPPHLQSLRSLQAGPLRTPLPLRFPGGGWEKPGRLQRNGRRLPVSPEGLLFGVRDRREQDYLCLWASRRSKVATTTKAIIAKAVAICALVMMSAMLFIACKLLKLIRSIQAQYTEYDVICQRPQGRRNGGCKEVSSG